jgi:CSLREA domain-containing protein
MTQPVEEPNMHSKPAFLSILLITARNQGRRLLLIALLLAFSQVQPPAPARAAGPINVTTTVDEAGVVGSGCSLREAITAANTNAAFGGCPAGSPGADVINLPAGTYTLSIPNPGGVNEDNNATGDLDINQSLTIQGAGAATTIIQAGTTNTNGIDKVIAANPTCAPGVNVTLSGVTVRNGRNSQAAGSADFSQTGAGIDYCANGTGETFTLSDAVISDNTNLHGYGGGLNIDSLPGSLTVTISNVTFQNNSIANDGSSAQGTGAGINIFGDSPTVNISGSTFSGNQVLRTNGAGGAIAYRPSSTTAAALTISGSTFSNNSAVGGGGAIYSTLNLGSTQVSIQNSAFTGNSAGATFGGALYLANLQTASAYTLNNLLISGNSANSGGGVYMGPGSLTLTNSRLVNNSATSGSGLYKSIDAGTVTAAKNWWGCSTGPAAAPCNTAATAGGGLSFTPWFRNLLTSAISPLVTNESALLSASFLTDSNGAAVAPASLTQEIGLPVTLAADQGSLSAAQTSIQAAGTATATYTASAPGSVVISARVDNDPGSGPSANVLTLTVSKANTTTIVGSHTPNPSIPGQALTVSASVNGVFGNNPTAPTGTITVKSGSATCTITLPATSCSLTLSAVGDQTISATYNGDANFNASPDSAGVSQIVGTPTFLPVVIR